MPQGILFRPGDGGRDMEITAGLRCPVYSGAWTGGPSNPVQSLINYVPGSEIFCTQSQCVDYRPATGTNIIGTVRMIQGFSIGNGTIQPDYWQSDNTRGWTGVFSGGMWQIYPIMSGSGSGILVQSSSDFTIIPSNSQPAFCVWRGSVTVNGDAYLPSVGIPISQLMVFGKWSAPGVTVELTNGVISAYVDRVGTDVPASVTIDIAIFSAVEPVPGPGITIMSGGRCVFSLTRRPFLFLGQRWTPSFSPSDIGDNMVMLGNYGYDSAVSGGFDFMKILGIVRNGNTISLGRGKIRWQWTDRYSIVGRRITYNQVLLVPNMY